MTDHPVGGAVPAPAAGAARPAAKKRILFVDDEPLVLEGLRSMLWQRRRQWEMVFAVGSEAALQEVQSAHFDVMVTDLRMPKTDGAALLALVHEMRPGIARIVLSGEEREESALRALAVTHQFLAKPCDAALLESTIERACGIQALIGDPKVRALVGQVGALPSRPEAYSTLARKLAGDDISVTEVAAVLEQDMAMCAKILQIANSAFFALPRRVTRIEEAVSGLGFRVIRDLSLSASVFRTGHEPRGIGLESLQAHAVLVGGIARRVVKDRKLADDAFVAGMLHDVGILILASQAPERFDELAHSLRAKPGLLHVREEEMFGVTHAQLGAYLLGLWGLPYSVMEAVAHHHGPSAVPQQGLDLLACVHIADALAQEVTGFDCEVPGALTTPIDVAYLEALGVIDSLEEWRDMVRASVSDMREAA